MAARLDDNPQRPRNRRLHDEVFHETALPR